MSFREFLREGKQVGVIYHFTRPENIKLVLNKEHQKEFGLEVLEFISKNGHFSTTRSPSLTTDFTHPVLSAKGNRYIVRLALDGTKLSNKFKVRPILGLNSNDFDIFGKGERVPRNWQENEEVILRKHIDSTFKLKDYLLQIDIYNKYDENTEELKKTIEDLLSKNNLNVPVNIVRHFVKIDNHKTNTYRVVDLKENEEYTVYDSKYLEFYIY